jgi:uncharacterized protein YeaO (DUF488 family)
MVFEYLSVTEPNRRQIVPVRTKRVYEDSDPDDGIRVLVDRLWPRGVSKEQAQLDDWLKGVAPSDELREWFDHDPDRWDEFRERYRGELDERSDEVRQLLDHARSGTLTLVYAAADEEHNNAVVLADYLTERLDDA